MEETDIVSGATPKKKSAPYVVSFFGICSFHCLSLQSPPVEGESSRTFGITGHRLKWWIWLWPDLRHSKGERTSLCDYPKGIRKTTVICSVFACFSIMIINFFSICRAPQASPTASTADTMKEDFLSPTAAGSELDTGVADAAPRCV